MSSTQPQTRRWLTAIPMQYVDGIGFWDRDSALLCPEFAKRGVDSRFVALGEPGVRKDVPLILCTLDQMKDPGWWRQWEAEGVQLSAWAVPRFEPIARAIKASGAKLAVHCDSNGIKSPRTGFWQFLYSAYVEKREEGSKLASIIAPGKAVLYQLSDSAHDQGMLLHLSHADLILVESPLAVQRFARLFRYYGREDLVPRLEMQGHPVPNHFTYETAVPKRPELVAVGRWASYAKDAPLLMRALARVLACQPEYSVSIIGSGEETVRRLMRPLPESVRARIKVVGKVANRDLVKYHQSARVICVSSRSESFNIAVAEALCCGCSVAGPADVPSMHYFAGASSGSLAIRRTDGELADAILCEIDAWAHQERDPVKLSAYWRERLLAASHVETFLKLGGS